MRNDTCGFAGKEKREHLCHVAKTVLDRRGYDTDLPLLKELTGSYEYNNKKILRKIRWYKVVGYVLLITIPTFTALLAVAVNIEDVPELPGHEQQEGEEGQENAMNKEDASKPPEWFLRVAPYLSLLLVVLTVFNAAFKPESRFPVCARIGLDLFHWRLGWCHAGIRTGLGWPSRF